MIDLPHKKNAEEVLGKEAGEEAIVEVRPSVEADATAEPELPLSVTEQDPISVNITDASADVEDEAPKPAADLEPLAMPTEEPNAAPDDTGSNAMVDAMYGDDYNEFEDNGGDDEDMTSDTEVDIPGTATEAVDPVTDGTLPVSKSGEDLYGNDDNEFEEEDLPNTEETEAEGVPVSTGEEPAASSSFIDAQGEEGLGVADNDPVTGNPDSLDHVNMPESEAPSDNNGSSEVKEDESGAVALENASVPLEAEGDIPSTAVEENALIPTDEPKEADKGLPQDGSTPADDGTGSVDVCVPDGDTEEAEKPQELGSSLTNPFEVDVVPNDPDAPASSTKEESNESAILNSGSNPDPYEEGGFDDDLKLLEITVLRMPPSNLLNPPPK
ncbi:hypothetical protein BBJ29_006541 [Phytophthora kernoviae]|uniref:Uncharacterized protein n=1 Tax=Phytophthora kernoviae TaxID=325452 RepID=A0A3F2RHR4_9STRA|nr:hypothetical protein BBP00_00007583 [Phytophthora kernoviae]RLN65211.1 hypothetical protein BBJ29_006541 [Phytophthora kernoviae]